ncbi:hypothetical protein ACCO45_008375 [Purpureocillium lilacinum]|uniref:Uncharacterized protein n=1 Tax=Purpureocillium lilacinum TaxID=33203 RepID=A0ACC4DPP1_PURLI
MAASEREHETLAWLDAPSAHCVATSGRLQERTSESRRRSTAAQRWRLNECAEQKRQRAAPSAMFRGIVIGVRPATEPGTVRQCEIGGAWITTISL